MRNVLGLLAALLLGLSLAACTQSSNQPPPPPPAQLGQSVDWGNGNRVQTSAPQSVSVNESVSAVVVTVAVHNGAQNAVPGDQYRADVKVDDRPVTSAVFGFPNAAQQVQSNSDGTFSVVTENPGPDHKLTVSVNGPNGVQPATFEGQTGGQ